MKQGKKQKIFDFETLIIGITWLLVLFMFAVSIVSCDSGNTGKTCTPEDGVYCVERNQWWTCEDGEWTREFGTTQYCENDVLYEGQPSVCTIEDEEIEYLCYTWYCLGYVYQRIKHDGDCDPESVLP